MKRKIYKLTGALILVVFTCINVTFADSNTCTLNGSWSIGFGGVMTFIEVNHEVNLMNPMKHPYCDQLNITGVNDGQQFNLKVVSLDSSCRVAMNLEGKFAANDCNNVTGYMKTKFDGSPEVTVPFMWYRNRITITKPDSKQIFAISAKPAMPEIYAEALPPPADTFSSHFNNAALNNLKGPPYTWGVKVEHDTIPGKIYHRTQLPEFVTNDLFIHPNFDLLEINQGDKGEKIGGIMGGDLTLSIEHFGVLNDYKIYKILGTNPGQKAIEGMLEDPITRQIACLESNYRQFVANREGGIGMPVIGRSHDNNTPCGIGLMQICQRKNKPNIVWNWRDNLRAGIAKYKNSLDEAEEIQDHERNRLNKDRLELHLPICPKGVPTQLTPQQVKEEAIRRYNCGREFRWEPRDAPNCEGAWVHHQSCEDDENIEEFEEDYVKKVLQCKLRD